MKNNHYEEFEKMFSKYKEETENISGGLVETNKADFIKQYVFYLTVVYPVIKEYADILSGKKII